jgi:hypothetical protein
MTKHPTTYTSAGSRPPAQNRRDSHTTAAITPGAGTKSIRHCDASSGRSWTQSYCPPAPSVTGTPPYSNLPYLRGGTGIRSRRGCRTNWLTQGRLGSKVARRRVGRPSTFPLGRQRHAQRRQSVTVTFLALLRNLLKHDGLQQVPRPNHR